MPMGDTDNPEMAPTSPKKPSRRRRAPSAGLSPGAVIAGRYRIESCLASGGMGRVYRAQDLDLDVPLALKTIRPKIASDPDVLRRFKQEVLLARSVTHPNVCRIYDLGRDETTGVLFLTMEFLPGETLASRIRTRGVLPTETALALLRQMAEALDAAHRAGIVHRDFKSANVMLVPAPDGNRAVIMDFGLAMAVGSGLATVRKALVPDAPAAATEDADTRAFRFRDRTVTHELPAAHSGEIVGTPAYMSPEQVRGSPAGPASDLYALGVVLFEMCTGHLPFGGATAIEIARAHLTRPPPRPSKLAAIDDAWERTILRLLSKEPDQRHATAREVVLTLEGRVNGKEVARYSLPAERDVFVGRTTELEALAAHLERPGSEAGTRLLTLLGPGGTGKTRLAQRYGWESLSRWPGGVWFSDLSEARSVEGIAKAVASALDVPLGKDPVVQLGHAIAGRGENLIILDNFEQVAEHADATLERWLERATETSFLVTSRERLRLPGEAVHELEPLDPTTHAVELFEVRAQGNHPGFRIDESNRNKVEGIVRRLDGLPLAIELAAARLRMLSLDQLRDRLAERFKILAGGKRGRHATLRKTLDWSWELLHLWERSAIAQISVFEGGFALEAAEAVIDLSSHGEAPLVLDVLQSLVDKSWLRAKAALGAPRFEMYMTVHDYAREKLRPRDVKVGAGWPIDPTSPSEVEARHGAYYAEMGTEESVELLHRPGGVRKRAALQLESDNLVAACLRAITRRDEETAAAAYVAASVALELRGPIAASVRLGLDVIRTVHSLPRRARAVFHLANAERLSGKMEQARGHFEEALAIHREVGDRRNEGKVLGNLGLLSLDQGRMAEACEHLEAALAIQREVGNRRVEGIVLDSLGTLHRRLGRMEEARAHFEAALAIHREVGNRRFEGNALNNLGALHGDLGRMEEARVHFEAAVVIHREVGDRRVEGIGLGNLGVFNLEQGRLEEAREHFEAALVIHREVGNRRAEGLVLGNLGAFHHDQGRLEEARSHYQAALAVHREVGHRRAEGVVLGSLGSLCCRQGHMEEARHYFDESISILRDLSDRLELGKVLCSVGEYELRQADPAASRAALTEAESIAEDLAMAPESELARRIEELRGLLSGEGSEHAV